jgi:hypothetical protein
MMELRLTLECGLLEGRVWGPAGYCWAIAARGTTCILQVRPGQGTLLHSV